MVRGTAKRREAAPGYWRVPSPWLLLNSMGFTISLLVTLVIVSVIGVMVPQGAPESAYSAKYGALFGRLIVVLGFDHIFRVWWYVTLWGVVVAGLLVCSFNRLPFIVRSAFGKTFLRSPSDFKTYRLNAELGASSPAVEAMSEVKSALKRRGFRLHECPTSGNTMRPAFARKGGLERFGPFVTHISIVVILLGGMLGSILASRHNQPATGGQTFEVPDLSHRASLRFHAKRLLGRVSELDLLRDEMAYMDWRALPEIPEKKVLFKVRVDDFEIERTPEGRIADYKTTATVLDPDSLFTKVIEVNEPLVYEGYYFYQSSYGYSSRTVELVGLVVTDKTGASVTGRIDLPPSTPVGIPGTELTVEVTDFIADFIYDIETKTAKSRSEEHRNPAVKIVVYRDGVRQFDQWLMFRSMESHSSKDEEYDFRIVGYDPTVYTVLEARTHPVIDVVWTGFGLGVVGIFLSFYVTQRRVWIGVVEGKDNSSEVLLAAASHKGREAFRKEFEEIVEGLRGRLK